MVEEIKKTKDQFLQHMEQMIADRGIARLDVKMLGEYADIVKDLAQAEKDCWKAEYYKTVTEAMEGGSGSSGYTSMRSSGNMGSMGTGGRRGYGSGSSANGGTMMGHSDPVATIRDMMATASPEMRMQIKTELSNMGL